jgi:UDP-2,3-diacylglucosamine hydrolase
MSYTNLNPAIYSKTYFIADIHLSPDKPEITRNFLKFLSNINGDALYILGDFFELWIGDDYLTDFHYSIFNALKKASLPIYLMPGNRDFLMNKIFSEKSGCKLLSDPSVIKLYGYNILLTHGDSLCLKNPAHKVFRRMTQNKILQFLFLQLPLKIRKYIAYKIQFISRKNYIKNLAQCKTIDYQALEKLLEKHPAEYLIHGHTHQYLQEIISLPQAHANIQKISRQKISRIVLGDWLEKPSYLIIESGENSLKININFV